MHYTSKGMLAGLAATVVAAALLMLNAEAGFLPELYFIPALGTLLGGSEATAWIAFFAVGAAIGGLFAWLDPDLPGDSLRQRGVVVASVLWFVTTSLVMPLAGFGFFGLGHSIVLPVAAFAWFAIFGAVMGGTYNWLLLQTMPLRYRHMRES